MASRGNESGHLLMCKYVLDARNTVSHLTGVTHLIKLLAQLSVRLLQLLHESLVGGERLEKLFLLHAQGGHGCARRLRASSAEMLFEAPTKKLSCSCPARKAVFEWTSANARTPDACQLHVTRQEPARKPTYAGEHTAREVGWSSHAEF